MVRVIFDLEANGLDDATVIHSLVLKDIDTGEVLSCHAESIPSGLEALEQAELIVGHNVLTFDLPLLRRLYPAFKPVGKVRDTLLCSRLIWTDLEDRDHRLKKRNPDFPATAIGSHSLEAWGHRLGVKKDSFGKTADWKVWIPEMQTYCEQDVVVTEALWKVIEKQNYSETAIELEHEFQIIIDQQERFGFRFDKERAAALYAVLVGRREEIKTQLQTTFPPRIEIMKTPAYWVSADGRKFPTKTAATKAGAKEVKPGPMKTKTIPFNPASRDQVAERLIEKGWTPVQKTETGRPKIDETVLESIALPEAKLLNEYLLLEKRVGQVATGAKAWMKLEKNGRIHGRVITNGAVTGRVTHIDPNMSQVPAVDKPYGKECRALFCADQGYDQIGADGSGMQLRCLAHYMAKYDNGQYATIILEGDIHTVNQQAAGIDTRNNAKTFIYAYLFGAGGYKIGTITGITDDDIAYAKKAHPSTRRAAKDSLERLGIGVDDRSMAMEIKGRRLKAQFEEKTPALAQLKNDIQLAVEQRGYLVGLDGRKFHIRSAHSALNTLLQGAEAVLMKRAVVLFHTKLKQKGLTFGKEFAQLGYFHDEVQAQALPEYSELIGKTFQEAIRESGESFNFRIRLDGEFKIGKNWADCH